jgi:hypothetical protein
MDDKDQKVGLQKILRGNSIQSYSYSILKKVNEMCRRNSTS